MAEPQAPAAALPLQLEVFLDEKPARLIGAFTKMPGGKIASQRKELREIGVEAPGAGGDDEVVLLDSIPGLVYRYDEARQSINLVAPIGLRSTHDYNGQGATTEDIASQTALGAVLNYDFFTSAFRSPTTSGVVYQGASASLDARLFSQFGTLNQTAILGSTTTSQFTALRLDTNYTYSDPNSLTVYKAGDTISSGLAWTRPLRIGGLQVQRNFGLRPDLVTLPLPSVSGSAAVPSTLDVYVNNIKTFSQDVDQGPYRISNLPLIGGDGTARVVLRDASGHEIEQRLPFFSSARLLKPGLSDYSIEIGLPRRFYGVSSNDYAKKPIGSVSLRRGIFDWLTLEGHGEGGAGIYNGGVGAVARVFSRAALTSAVSASHSRYGNGLQSYLAFETRMFGIGINIASQRTFGTYDDLASVTAAIAPNIYGGSVAAGGNTDPFAVRTSIRPARVQDRISLSLPVPFDPRSAIGISFINLRDSGNVHSRLLSASLSRSLPYNSSAYVTIYKDFIRTKQAGGFVGLSVPLGERMSASAGFSAQPGGWSATSDISRTLGREIGDYGWRVRDTEGRGKPSYQSAAVSYRSAYGRVEAGASNQRGSVLATVEVDGSISTLGGGIFAANRIDDSFAVVDVGVPGVDVLYENRRIGQTNGQGKLLVPELRSYQRNKIEIDPRGLPIDSDAPTTQDVIAPADRSGILVNFRVKTNVQAAVVILKDKTGKELQAGLTGKLDGASENFVVGYDGRAYINGLGRTNRLVVDLGGANCSASFDFVAKPNAQVTVGPVVCQ